MGLDACQKIQLPKIFDQRGSLTYIEGNRHIPFPIKRIYYLYDVPGGAERGGHAHKELYQLIIALSGSFDLMLDDGDQKKTFYLSKPFEGVLITPMIWRELNNFSSGSVCMVLASDYYDENDYFRNYEIFKQTIARNK